jgi:hypothetical protein
MKKPEPSFEIKSDFKGKTYSASYSIGLKVVTLNSMYGRLSTQIGGSNGKNIAEMLFREILEAAHLRGEI